MEQQFYINWQVIIKEAKQRREKQKLTQQKLATYAKVSAPTVSHFENGDKNMQLDSILRILDVLGMVDQRRLDFSETRAEYLPDRGVVRFVGKDGDKTISCKISKEALDDHFNGSEKDPIKTFIEHRTAIEHEARRKYITEHLEVNEVLIRSKDLN